MRVFIILPFLALVGCNNISDAATAGPQSSRIFAITGPATAIDVRGSDDVEVTRGRILAVRATGPKTVLDHLRVSVRDGTLIIDRDPGVYTTGRGAKVSVTMPAIAGVAVDGSSDVTVDRADGPRFAASLSGSGDLTIAALQVGAASVDLNGSGDVRANGHADTLALSTAGSGDIAMRGVSSDRATLSTRGSGGIEIGATRSATGATSGSGDITVGGHPACTIAKSGSGDVRCG